MVPRWHHRAGEQLPTPGTTSRLGYPTYTRSTSERRPGALLGPQTSSNDEARRLRRTELPTVPSLSMARPRVTTEHPVLFYKGVESVAAPSTRSHLGGAVVAQSRRSRSAVGARRSTRPHRPRVSDTRCVVGQWARRAVIATVARAVASPGARAHVSTTEAMRAWRERLSRRAHASAPFQGGVGLSSGNEYLGQK
jgi:hypothetical protein